MNRTITLEDKQVRLEQAEKRHKAAAEDMKREFFVFGERVINGSALYDQLDFDQWLVNTERNHNPATVREDWVVATTFFVFRQCDGRMLGMIDVRHALTVPFLQEYGGHIGYAIRPSERQKGYAAATLRLALQYCAELGLQAVRLGCYTDNQASIRTMERCGGKRIEEKPYTDGKQMYIYEILVS